MIRKEYIHKDIFEFEAGGSMEGLKVVYHCSEKPYEPGQKVIWICHALTANSDAQDWWPELVGPGRLFDTEKYFVVCANMLGSAYGSSGPASINPATGKPFYFDFPKVTVRDIVRANDLVRRHLGIKKIDLMVGGSIGGFQSVEWTIMEPELFEKAVFIACGARVTPWLTAWEESQRMALEPPLHSGHAKASRAARPASDVPEASRLSRTEATRDTMLHSRKRTRIVSSRTGQAHISAIRERSFPTVLTPIHITTSAIL